MQIFKAKSGITVVLRPVASKLVNARYYVKCGAVEELKPAQHGLVHALEHMCYGGTKTRDWQEIIRGFSVVGSEYNASTTYLHTNYMIDVPEAGFASAFEILADIMYNSIFPAERWDIEKKSVCSELQNNLDNSDDFIKDTTFQHTLGKHHHLVGGTIENILKAKIEDLTFFYDKFYKGDNLFIVVAGNLNKKQVLNIVNNYDRCSNLKLPTRQIPAYGFNSKSFSVYREGEAQVYFTGIKKLDFKQTPKNIIIGRIMTKVLSDYLFEEIREKRGLSYGIQVNLETDIPGASYIVAFTYTDAGRADDMKRVLVQAVLDFPKHLTEERIHRSKMGFLRATMESERSSGEIAKIVGQDFLDGSTEDPLAFRYRILEEVSNNTIRNFASTYISNEKIKLGILRSK